MEIEKTFIINRDRDTVWEFITTPELAAQCIPGCEEVTEKEPGKYCANIKIQMGPIKTSFIVDVEMVEEKPPEFSRYVTSGQEGTNASRMNAESTLSLVAVEDNVTEVSYSSNISITGRLGKFGLGMMRKKADAVGEEFVQNLCVKIEGETTEKQENTQDDAGKNESNSGKYIAIGIGIILIAALAIIS